ncbi:CHAT domain-containing protein [Streptomyces europaeiscabiei]|uniref:CHAT domain-containing protein n=1 Tax=Streptomyces europaeiscabiei TaxID=146819 RepID=UPI0029AA3E58|nr:CHAT domain-containing protein [Streptomyces europaeiscabiei]MDX3842008.1 CHAT domain-containing protein [Streptomyces europaeiscabiei]
MTEYEELRLRVRHIGAHRHLVTTNGAGGAVDVIEVDGGTVDALRARWEHLIDTELALAPLGDRHTAPRLRDLGRDVFDLLFGGRIEQHVRSAYDHARGLRPPRGLRIRFDLPPALSALPLEALCSPADDPGQAPALQDGMSLVRSLQGGPLGGRAPDACAQPSLIRLLVVCASPAEDELPLLRAEVEIKALLGLPEIAVQTTVVNRATRGRLESAVGEHSDLPTALLLVAHGTYDDEIGKGVVHLETPDGGTDRVPSDLLSAMLLRVTGLRLVVLNLCSGADSAHTEPFSGLAQALIGGGVPAVVAMRGRVSDLAAGVFGPELLKGVAANLTIDEALARARRRISHVPEHTAVEWATPSLFLHEECRHGWLFKAREVRDDGHPADDPLRRGAEALRAFHSPTGHLEAAQLIEAARFQRLSGGWEQVLRILATRTRQFQAEQQLLRAEAAHELRWPQVQSLCESLAAERAEQAAAALAGIRETLPDDENAWLPVLEEEVRRLGRLGELLDEAHAAARCEKWATALNHCEEILAQRPSGFGDAVGLRDTAREELRLADACARADRASAAGDWATAEAALAEALGHRTGHRPAVERAAYLRGRAAEEAGDWRAATVAYACCPARYDTPVRSAHARGRVAALDGDWSTADAAFADALDRAAGPGGFDPGPDGSRPVDGRVSGAQPGDPAVTPQGVGDAPLPFAPPREAAAWAAYAAGRVAEAGERWAEAADHFATADGFFDGPLRAHHARGRAAAENGAWSEALAAMEAASAGRPSAADADAHRLSAPLPRPGPWVDTLRRRVRESADAAAGAGDWHRAVECLRLLPEADDHTRSLRRFAEGRIAEAAGDWEAAAETYADSTHPDAGPRRRYALGRLCALRQDWEAARDHLDRVPEQVHDFPQPPAELLLYTRARAAYARGDWNAVVDGFGGLPDGHADGDVGHRRKYARARLAEHQEASAPPGTWTSVLGHLDGVPDKALDGAVGLLRCKAAGMHAQSGGDWERARDLYAGFATEDEEFTRLHGYAQARLHELADRWAEALTAYRDLPEEHGDTASRTRYAHARIDEAAADDDAERWHAIRASYEELTESFAEHGGFADSSVRKEYARARAAEAEGNWEEAHRVAEALRAHSDAPRIAGYARGRLAEADQDWHRAVDAFRGCGDHRDADRRLAHCEGRLLEERGRLTAAAEAYERAGDDHEEAGARAAQLRTTLRALPWTDGPIGESLVADPLALRDTTFPYRALRDAGIGPDSSMDVVNDASFTLMELGGRTWDWSERVAWDRLRLPGLRLELDALLYRWHAPTAVREAVTRIAPDGEPDPLAALCEQFPREAPLLLLLARGRDAALTAWRQRLATAPGDMSVVHGLAVAHLWQAQELEDSGAWEHAVRAWEAALVYWAALLSDKDYWDGWRTERASRYRRNVTPDDMAQLCWALSRHLFGQLATAEQRHTEQGRPAQAEAYRELTGVFEAELGGARVLRYVGGLPSVPGTGGAPACGPRYLRMLRLEVPLAEQAAELSAAAHRGQDPGEYAVRELRWAFSELARSSALSEAHRFEQALDALPVLGTLTDLPEDCGGPGARANLAAHLRECGHCQDFVHRNPAYLRLPGRHARLVQDGTALAVQARLALAQAALTSGSGGVDRALTQWAEAVRASAKAGMEARTKQAVVHMVLGRVEALRDVVDHKQRDTALNEAVTLLEEVGPVLRPLSRDLAGRLDTQLSKVLSQRGVWRASERRRYGLSLDGPAAEADLRRALALNPESGHARDNLVRSLVFTTDGRVSSPAARLRAVEEALALLHTGLGQPLPHSAYRETLGETLNALETLVAGELGIDGMTELMRTTAREQPPDETDLPSFARRLAGLVPRDPVEGDLPRAMHLLIRAVRADPPAPEIRSLLLDMVRRRLDTLPDPLEHVEEETE